MTKRDQNRQAGRFYNLPAPEARRLIEMGKAVVVLGPSETKPIEPGETKLIEPGTRRSKKKRISADSES